MGKALTPAASNTRITSFHRMRLTLKRLLRTSTVSSPTNSNCCRQSRRLEVVAAPTSSKKNEQAGLCVSKARKSSAEKLARRCCNSGLSPVMVTRVSRGIPALET